MRLRVEVSNCEKSWRFYGGHFWRAFYPIKIDGEMVWGEYVWRRHQYHDFTGAVLTFYHTLFVQPTEADISKLSEIYARGYGVLMPPTNCGPPLEMTRFRPEYRS